MAKCAYCASYILFGGVREDDLRFCNEACQEQGYLLAVAAQVPDEVAAEYVAEVHQGDCPKCGGPGPIDVYTSHYIWSALLLTSWRSKPQVSCRGCGIKSYLKGIAFCSVAGWWGFPWGLLGTPIQILRNVYGVFSAPDAMVPSPQFEKIARLELAAQMLESNQVTDDVVNDEREQWGDELVAS